MKIAVISPWYSLGMGYAENFLPKFLVREGNDVTLITSTAQIYYNAGFYNKIYEPYIGKNIVEECDTVVDGYRLIRRPLIEHPGMPNIEGLYDTLCKLQPDVIQTFDFDHITTYIAAKYAAEHSIGLFTECHRHASVMGTSLADQLKNKWQAFKNRFNSKLRFIGSSMSKCYPIAEDVYEILVKYYHAPKAKLEIQSLGVDTDLFCPVTDDKEKQVLRYKHGFKAEDIICIYTGRFTESKGPRILAEAVSIAAESNPSIKALFVGRGDEEYTNFLRNARNCSVHPFVPVRELPQYYQLADIGVWPREESTSQLDALACGLPIIISNQTKVEERIQGSGLTYKQNDPKDLSERILSLAEPEYRKRLGIAARQKAIEKFSWTAIARKRIKDYQYEQRKV